MKPSIERKLTVDKLCKRNGYKKHHHGIKFTKIYFSGGKHLKVNNSGIIKGFK